MTRIGSVYGEALYALAREEGLEDSLLKELDVLKDGFAREPDFLRLLAAPNLPKEERCRILDDCFRGKVHPYLLNFLKILTEKGYSRHFPHCCDAYREHYNQDHGILPVCAVTAVPLTGEQTVRLTRKLEAITGKTIALTNRVDPRCLGGVRLDYDGKRLDDTVSHRLESVRGTLKAAVL